MKKLLFILTLAVVAAFSACGPSTGSRTATAGTEANATEDNKNETIMSTTMQDLLTRRSVRSYTDSIPPREVIEEICKAGTYAPTGMNRQAPIIVAVTNREVRDRLSKLNAAVFGPDNDSDPFYGAPVVLVVLADTTADSTAAR